MSNIVIKAEDISKQYRLGLVGTNTLKGDLQSWWYRMRGKEDPTLKIGHENRLDTSDSEYVWALKDINFEIKQGDVVGIIGKNGAGKSTLLKIISRITTPTTGQIKVKGRIASLLEVGTGFQGDLTGRENIFLNGAILGMKKDEIRRKFDEIVDFSGVGAYIDTPVKRYSSGMYVRLAFAVAAHLEPEILIVDEVLAVGDAEFQKKALGKMHDISEGQGRTVLFVSHNMAAVKSLCSSAILIEKGLIKHIGKTDECVSKYLGGDLKYNNHKVWKEEFEIQNKDIQLTEIGIKALNKNYNEEITMDDEIEFIANYTQLTENCKLDLTLHFKDEQGNKIFSTGTTQEPNNHLCKKIAGLYVVKAIIPANFFNWGAFSIDLYIVEDERRASIVENDFLSFVVANKAIELGKYMGKEPGAIHPLFEWEKKYIQ